MSILRDVSTINIFVSIKGRLPFQSYTAMKFEIIPEFAQLHPVVMRKYYQVNVVSNDERRVVRMLASLAFCSFTLYGILSNLFVTLSCQWDVQKAKMLSRGFCDQRPEYCALLHHSAQFLCQAEKSFDDQAQREMSEYPLSRMQHCHEISRSLFYIIK
jgi:hypothetical protein